MSRRAPTVEDFYLDPEEYLAAARAYLMWLGVTRQNAVVHKLLFDLESPRISRTRKARAVQHVDKLMSDLAARLGVPVCPTLKNP